MRKRLPLFTDIREIEELGGGDYSAKNGLVLYQSSKQGIVLKDLSTGEMRKVTAGGRGEGSPSFSYDGKKVLFLSAKESGRQLYLYDIAAGIAEKISDFAGPIMEPLCSPDGKKVLFASSISSDSGERKQERPDEPVVIEDFGYKFDGLGYIQPDGHQHLFVLDIESRKVRKATKGASFDFMHAAWAPDSESFVCVSDAAHKKSESLMYDLFLISVREENFGEMKRISEGPPIVSYPNPMRPVFTPDGSAVIMGAFDTQADSAYGYPPIHLFSFPVTGEGPEVIFEPDEECYQCVQFPYNAGCGHGMEKLQISEDGKMVYFHAGWQGEGVLYALSLSGDHHAKKLLSGKFVCHGLSRPSKGKALVSRSLPDTPEQYLLLDLQTGETSPAVQSAEDYLQEVSLQNTYDFFFDTEDGEGRIHTFVMPPADMEAGKKYPAILYVHGGPHPFYTFGFTPEMQAYAAAGYAMIFCNPRGSTGYGKEHADVRKSMDGTAFRDVLQCVKEAAKRYDFIDSERVGATGGSYGGYMTNELALHTEDVFRCFVTQRSMPAEMISYCSTDMTEPASGDYESYEAFMMEMIAKSQVSYAENLKAPLLILHGEDDLRCPVEGAHQFYTALKDIHPEIPVRLVIFPHTAHDQPSEPRLAKRYYEEIINWFDRYLKE